MECGESESELKSEEDKSVGKYRLGKWLLGWYFGTYTQLSQGIVLPARLLCIYRFKQVPGAISIGPKGLIVTLSRKDIGFVVPEKQDVVMPLDAYRGTQCFVNE
jgi:hypothetical protein